MWRELEMGDLKNEKPNLIIDEHNSNSDELRLSPHQSLQFLSLNHTSHHSDL